MFPAPEPDSAGIYHAERDGQVKRAIVQSVGPQVVEDIDAGDEVWVKNFKPFTPSDEIGEIVYTKECNVLCVRKQH